MRSPRLYVHFLQGMSTDFFACLYAVCAWREQLLIFFSCQPVTCASLVGSNIPPPVSPGTWPGASGRISQHPTKLLPTKSFWELPSEKMRPLIFKLKGSDKSMEARKCTQSSGRLAIRFLNVGNFGDIGCHSRGMGGRGGTDWTDTGTSPLPCTELWCSAAVRAR